MTLYEVEGKQIGKTVDDPIFEPFPEIIALAEKIKSERFGYGTYEFFDNAYQKKIKKGTFWTTVGDQSDGFRLMLTVDLE